MCGIGHGITQRRSLNIANGAFAHNAIHIDPSCDNLINDLEQVVTGCAGAIVKTKQHDADTYF